jgi:hypothetical protein
MPRRSKTPTEALRLKVLAICARIAKGETLTRICKEKGQPSRDTVMDCVTGDAELATVYARARSSQADALFEKIVQMAEDTKPEDANANRVKIDALKWVASKLAPRRYGDRLELEHSGEQPNVVVRIGNTVIPQGGPNNARGVQPPHHG